MSTPPAFDAVVLAGGQARRLDGVDKAAVDIGGSSLLDRVLGSLVDARQVVVVGPPRPLPTGIVATREEPPGGGPVAGLAAGLGLVTAPLVVVLACDLPFLTEATVRRLLSALADSIATDYDGAQLVDGAGREQPLAAVYRTDQLRAALAALPALAGTPMRAAVAGLAMLGVADHGQAWDCDTWADVELARGRADEDLVEET